MTIRLNINQFYDAIAKQYVETYTKHPKAGDILKKYEKLLPRKSKILDLGCGPGFPVASFLVKKGHKVTGIDISKTMLNYARKFVKEGKFIFGDIRTIKLPGGYDSIISTFSLIHMPKKDAKKCIKKIYNLLNERGLLYISVIESEGEKKFNWFGKTTKYFYFKESEIKNILKKAKFKIIYLKRYTLKRKDKGPQMQIFIFAKKV